MTRSRTRKPAGPELFDAKMFPGTHCSVCGKPQWMNPSGVTCDNGHGGAPAYEDDRASTLPEITVTPVSAEPDLPPIMVVEVVDTPPVTIDFVPGKLDATTRRHAERMARAAVPKSAKVAHVKAAKQTRNHECHWPGCTTQVKPAEWGCKSHWMQLPKPIRDRIWAAYAPGQEATMTPSEAYLDAADDAQRWIARFLGTDVETDEPVLEFDADAEAPAPTDSTGGILAKRDQVPLVITTLEAAHALIPPSIWDEVLQLDGGEHYLNPGVHSDDCSIAFVHSCDCPVGYVTNVVTEGLRATCTAKSLGTAMTIGKAIEWGYELDVSYDERIAGEGSIVIRVPISGRTKPAAKTTATQLPDERVTEAEIKVAVAAVKESAAKAKAADRQASFRRTDANDVTIEFVEVPTRVLIDTADPAALLAGPRIDGAYVKAAPVIKASERESFDGAGVKAALLEHGATTVVLAPRVVSDGAVTRSAKEAAAVAVSAEQSVRDWFAGQTGITAEEREAALELALDILGGT